MAKKPAKPKFVLPAPPATMLCRACGLDRAPESYRIFSTEPPLRLDFCVDCERREGTIVLYRRYNAYGTPAIIDAVFKAARVVEARRTPDQIRLLVEATLPAGPATNEELLYQEMAHREMCRRRLIYYIKTFMPSYTPGWVHQDVCRRLERFVKDIEDGKSPRLMLAMPPRSGKSQIASDMLPSWILGKHPEWGVIGSSYAQSLPITFSRAIRDRMAEPEHRAIFDQAELRKDASGVEEWRTTKGGGYKAAGVGVGLTGFGGHVLIADDLLKDAEAASSEVIRDATWQWYQTVFRTRLAPGGGILLIGTRWHWHDPAGQALALDAELAKAGVPEWERENWEVVSYPALAEHDEYLMPDGSIAHDLADPTEALRLLRRAGEALHPERYPRSELLKIKNTTTPMNWSALYQQNPTPEAGDFFLRDDFRYRYLDPVYRPLCRRMLVVDYAISTRQRRDYTVAGVLALDHDDNLYVLEIRRGRWGTLQIAQNLAALCQKHNVEVYAGEQGAIHLAVWPIVQQELDKLRLYPVVNDTLVPIQDKETRARPLQGRVQRNKLFFSYDSPQMPEVYEQAEREMLQFPNSVNDDIVDMLAWGARLALNISLPNGPRPPPRQKSWTDKLRAASTPRSNFMAA